MSVRDMLRRIPVVRTFGSSGDPWSRSDRIAAWGLLLTAVGLILTYFTSVRSSSDETPLIRPSLEVATASAKESKKIDATDVHTDTNTREPNPYGVDSPQLDITVRNAGSGASLITQADLVFRQAVRLARCQQIGGEVNINAKYDVKVPSPDGDWLHVYAMETPFVLHREMRFEVQPNRHDRFALTIGPERIPEMSMPWIYEVDVSLRHDNGAVLPVGTVIMLSNGGQYGFAYSDDGSPIKPDDPNELQCLRRNASVVQEAVGRPGIKSSYLIEYHDDLKKLFG